MTNFAGTTSRTIFRTTRQTRWGDPVARSISDGNLRLSRISVPAGLSEEGLPLGLHLITKPFDEETLFRVGGVLEAAVKFEAKPRFLRGLA